MDIIKKAQMGFVIIVLKNIVLGAVLGVVLWACSSMFSIKKALKTPLGVNTVQLCKDNEIQSAVFKLKAYHPPGCRFFEEFVEKVDKVLDEIVKATKAPADAKEIEKLSRLFRELIEENNSRKLSPTLAAFIGKTKLEEYWNCRKHVLVSVKGRMI